jgi:outer membrane protein assembly factor BamB
MDEDGYAVLDLAWQHDCNPEQYRVKDGKPLKYATRYGPSEIIATPISYKGRVYTVIGQDPEHGEGVGNLACIDENGELVWSYSKINRSLSTISIQDDLLFVADFSGFIYCLDADTGKEHWIHDTKAHIWGSTLVADGKVYIGNEDGYMTILPASKKFDPEKDVREIDMTSQIFSSAIAANGVLFVATHTHLFAVAGPGNE